MNGGDIIKALEREGWTLKRGHHHVIHPTKPGLVTVPHPKRDLPIGTVKAIERQCGLKIQD